jgi:hypothetical protein
MDQQPICLFLEWKVLSGRAIHNEFASVLGADAIAHSTVTLYLQPRRFPMILVDRR